MAVKRGLGKGIDMLIPPEKNSVRKEKLEQTVKISKVQPNKEQPRRHFDEDSLIELSESIKQYGIIQPLVVQDQGEYYEIIAGERRWRAAKMAGMTEVPVIIKKYTSQEMMEISLIENIQRENLNPIEEAIAYQKLIQGFSLKQDEVAERVSKSRSAITNSMRLLNLDERVQQMIMEDMISPGHARTLLAIEDKEFQYDMATRIFDEKLSVREVERLVQAKKKKKDEKKAENDESYAFLYQDIEERMKRILGTKVSIQRKKNNKGKIEIEYYSTEELDRIMDLMKSIKPVV